MPRRGPRGALAFLILASALPPPPRAHGAERTPAQPQAGGIPVAKVALRGGGERSEAGGGWRNADEDFSLKTGDRLRTRAGEARLEFPWMTVTLAPSSTLSIPAAAVLSLVLDDGRAEVRAEGGDIIKLRTAEAEVRGGGQVVVRRQEGATLVSALGGHISLEAGGKTVRLEPGQGAEARAGQPPEVLALAEAPTELVPGDDPLYVRKGEAASLRWSSAGTAHHVQVLSLDGSEILLETDAATPPQSVELPWLGTFRWHVAQRDERGIEGLPSKDGYLCVVEK